MKRILMLLMSLATVMQLASCAPWPSAGVKGEFSRTLGVNLTDGHTVEEEDTHGGFLGDGTGCIALSFPDGRLEEQLAADPAWHSLPADETVQTLVWGTQDEGASISPCLTDSEGAPLVPAVQAGYYRLIDRHSDTQTPILERGSFNFTVGVYDSDARILYYCELDT